MGIVEEMRRVAQDRTRPEYVALSRQRYAEAYETYLGGMRLVGGVGNPSYLNGWKSTDQSTFYANTGMAFRSTFGSTLEFFRDRWGATHLIGGAGRSDDAFSTAPIIILPSEYRPKRRVTLPAGCYYSVLYDDGTFVVEQRHWSIAEVVCEPTGEIFVRAYNIVLVGTFSSKRNIMRWLSLDALRFS